MVEAGIPNHAIEVRLRRAPKGVRVTTLLWPEVEAFFEQWSGGLQDRPSAGRLWHPINPGEVITLWSLGLSQFQPGPSKPFSLLHSGCGLVTDNNFPNISFLRLVGASRPEGASVVVECVMSQTELKQVGQRISEACHWFYSEYIQPVNLRAYVGVDRLPTAA